MMPSFYCLLFSLIAFVNVMADEVDTFDTCPIMDPATIQRRICELQYRVEELHALLLVNDLPTDNQMASDVSGLKIQKQKRKNEFIRFGKRKNEFIRFGKRKNEFIRFGRSAGAEEPEEQFVAKRKNEFIRFG